MAREGISEDKQKRQRGARKPLGRCGSVALALVFPLVSAYAAGPSRAFAGGNSGTDGSVASDTNATAPDAAPTVPAPVGSFGAAPVGANSAPNVAQPSNSQP
jgi:hypothetical protein